MRTCGASRVSECAGAPPSPGSCKTRASGSYPRRAVLRFHYKRPTPAPAAIPAATFPLYGPSAVPAASPRAGPTYRRAVVYGFYSGLQLNIRQTGARFCCMKAYSLDLRHKILDAYDHKRGSQRAVAALFGVSRAFLEQWLRRRRTTGDIAPRPHAGGRQPRCDAAGLAVVRQFVREQPEATLEELCAQLHHQRGLRLSVAPMCRVLQRLGLPRTKRPFMPPNATRRGSSRPVPPTSNARPRSISGTCSLSMRPASISRCLACMAEPPGRSGASGPRR